MKQGSRLKTFIPMILILAMTGMLFVACNRADEEIHEQEPEVIEEIEEVEELEEIPELKSLEELTITVYNEIVLALINEPFAIQRFVESVELNDFEGADFNFELRLADVELDESILNEEALEIFNEFTFEELTEAVWVQQFGTCVTFELCGEDYEYCDCEFEELTEPCEDCIIDGVPNIWITFFNAGDFTLEVVLTLNEDFTGNSVSNDTSTISDGIEVEAGTEFIVELDVTVELFEDVDSLVERFEEILEDETLNVPFVAEQPTIIVAAPPIIVEHQPDLVPPVVEVDEDTDSTENDGNNNNAQTPGTPPQNPPPQQPPPQNPNPPTPQPPACNHNWVRQYEDRGSNQQVGTTPTQWQNSNGWAYGRVFDSHEAWSNFRWSEENIFHDNPTTSFRIIGGEPIWQWVPNNVYVGSICSICGARR